MLTPALALGTAGALLPDVGSLPGTLTSFRAPRGTLTLGCGSVATFVGSCRAAGLSWSLLLVCTLLQKGEKEKEDSLHCPCQQVCLYSHDMVIVIDVLKISLLSVTLATLKWVYLHRGLAVAAGTIRPWHIFLLPFHLQS
jgi:hypothetical protein